jgi:UDP-N-acetylmuramate dehydrogenase
MINIDKNLSLLPFNTFGVDVNAAYLFHLREPGELEELSAHPLFCDLISQKDKLLIMGQGSNILFTSDFDGLVIRNEIKGIKFIEADKSGVLIEAGAGVLWQDMVEYALSHNLAGIENLTLIPGTVGAAPVQNIGAYGVEAAAAIEKVRLFHLDTREWTELGNQECRFGYRDSIFKHELKNRAVICSVSFRLSKRAKPTLDYGNIREELGKRGIADPSLRQVSDVIAYIRRLKLPDHAELGNAGSFFKNPLVSRDEFHGLSNAFPQVRYFRQGEDYKISAGWLIEQAGWKAHRTGNAGCYDKQALIIVNYGGAAGAEILSLAEQIRESVLDKFGISLEREVEIVPQAQA